MVLSIVDCFGSGCDTAVKKLLTSKGVNFIDDCSQMNGLTAQTASQRGKLKGGGSLLAVFGCKDDHYDSSVACSGYGNKLVGFDTASAELAYNTSLTASNGASESVAASMCNGQGTISACEGTSGCAWSHFGCVNKKVAALKADGSNSLYYTCYSDSSTKAFPLNRMWAYVQKTIAAGPSGGNLYTLQTLWEESVASVEIGELHGSTLLDDEKKSGLNAMLTAKITSGALNMTRINFVEVNNVCDGGPALLAALKKL